MAAGTTTQVFLKILIVITISTVISDLVIFSTGYAFTTTVPRQQYPLQKPFFILPIFLTSAYFCKGIFLEN